MAKQDTPTTPTTFDWSSLPSAVEATAVASVGTRFDVEKEIPKVIRERVEESYAGFKTKTTKGRDGSTSVQPDPLYKWQWAPTAEVLEQFKTLAQKYGKYRPTGQITVRVGNPLDAKNVPDVPQNDGYAIRYAAKPLERKTARRLPGSAK